MTQSIKHSHSSSALRLVNPDEWKKIQSLFEKIIGVNVSLLDLQGNKVVESRSGSPNISDLLQRLDGKKIQEPLPAIKDAIKDNDLVGKTHFAIYGVDFFLQAVYFDGKKIGYYQLGPLILRRRETREFYERLCSKEKFDIALYLDRIRDVKLLSNISVVSILEFLQEMTQCFLAKEKSKIEATDLEPKILAKSRAMSGLLSIRYSHELSGNLLDISLGIVGGESGSVLILDPESQCFQIQSARGLNAEIIRDTVIPQDTGVAGLVAERGVPMLLNASVKDDEIRSHLTKTTIKSSIVIPMKYQEKLIGLICLNAESDNEKFSAQNLTLLDQLGKIASISFSRLFEE